MPAPFLSRTERWSFPRDFVLSRAVRVFTALLAVAGVAWAVEDGPLVAIQQALKEQQYLEGNPSGTLDQATIEALKRFQIQHGLRVTGDTNAETLDALAKAEKKTANPASAVGLPSAVAAEDEPSARERGRQIVESDREFMEKLERQDPSFKGEPRVAESDNVTPAPQVDPNAPQPATIPQGVPAPVPQAAPVPEAAPAPVTQAVPVPEQPIQRPEAQPVERPPAAAQLRPGQPIPDGYHSVPDRIQSPSAAAPNPIAERTDGSARTAPARELRTERPEAREPVGHSPEPAANYRATPEEARRVIEGYVEAAQGPTPDRELSFYAGRVNYFDSGIVTHAFIGQDQGRYYRRWPARKFTLVEEPEIVKTVGNAVIARFRLHYQLRRGADSASGATEEVVRLENGPDGYKITGIRERKYAP